MAGYLGFEPELTGERYFVSYKNEDSERIGGIACCLHEMGVRMWYDRGIEGGAAWNPIISENISECQAMIFFATKNTFSQTDSVCRLEYSTAHHLGKRIYVIWLDSFSIIDVNSSLRLWFNEVRDIQGLKMTKESEDEIAAWKILEFFKLTFDQEKLLNCAESCLINKKYDTVGKYCKEVLKKNPNEGRVYLLNLMAEYRVQQIDALKNSDRPLDSSDNYQKAIKLCDKITSSTLQRYNDEIKKRIERKSQEEIYNKAVKLMKSASSESDFKTAAKMFQKIKGFRDADTQAQKCIQFAEVSRKTNDKKTKNIIITSSVIIAFMLIVIIFLFFKKGTPVDPIGTSTKDNDTTTEGAFMDSETGKSGLTETNQQQSSESFIIVSSTGGNGLRTTKGTAIGAYHKFGSYEQDNDESNGQEEIEWLVLAKENDCMLVTSRYGLDWKPFDKEGYTEGDYRSNNWEECYLKDWLNGSFLIEAFTKEEQSKIQYVEIEEGISHPCSNDSENRDAYKIFLLSTDEIKEYFNADIERRKCIPTAYAVEQGASVNSKDSSSRWWLRSRGKNDDVAYVDVNGGMPSLGYGGRGLSKDKNSYKCAVRPAFWLKQ